MSMLPQAPCDARTLIAPNAREAADLVGELTLMLDRVGDDSVELAAVRMVTRRISDRLGQVLTLERLARTGSICADGWSPIDVVEELEHEAIALACGRVEVQVLAPVLAPQFWFFDRELVTMTLANALHSALMYARSRIALGFELNAGYLGFSVFDDGGAFPAELMADGPPRLDRGEVNGNALGIHFARLVAASHAHADRTGRLELANRPDRPGTRFTLWLP